MSKLKCEVCEQDVFLVKVVFGAAIGTWIMISRKNNLASKFSFSQKKKKKIMVKCDLLRFVINKYIFFFFFFLLENKMFSPGHICSIALLHYYVGLPHILRVSNNCSFLQFRYCARPPQIIKIAYRYHSCGLVLLYFVFDCPKKNSRIQ